MPVSALAITWQEVAAHPFLLNDLAGLEMGEPCLLHASIGGSVPQRVRQLYAG